MQLSRNLGLQQLWVVSHTHYLTFIFWVFKSWCEDALTSEMGPVTCVCADETMWHFFLDDNKSNLSTCLASITFPSTCCFRHPPSCPLCLTYSLTFRLYQDPMHPSSMPKTLRSPTDCTPLSFWAIKDNNISNVLYHITEHTTFPLLYVSALLLCCVNPVLVLAANRQSIALGPCTRTYALNTTLSFHSIQSPNFPFLTFPSGIVTGYNIVILFFFYSHLVVVYLFL